MKLNKSWQLGSPGTISYWVYDKLRRYLNRGLVRYLSETIDQNCSCRQLEAGSGTAFASSLLAQQPGVKLSVAMDIDLEAMLQARQRDPSLPVLVADLEHLPFACGSFSLVWNSSTVEHLTNRLVALQEMSRVTQHGGSVFIGVPYTYGPLGFQKWISNTSTGAWIGDVFDREKLSELVTDCGLHPKTSKTYFLRFFIGVLAEKPI